MPDVMMSLGAFRFSVDTAAYTGLRRRSEYRWADMERIDHWPSLQFVGRGRDSIDLRGVIYPHYKGGLRQIDSMREQAGKGQPLQLVTGRGENLGPYCIVEVEEEQDTFAMKGTPRRTEFRLRLEYYGPDKEPIGAKGTVSFTPPPARSLGAAISAPPALPSALDLKRIPQIVPAQLAPFAAGIRQAGMTPQQAASTLSAAVARLRSLQRTSASTSQLLTKIKWDYNDLQSGITRDPIGTISRLLTGVNGLGAGAQVALSSLFGADLVGGMNQLGAAFSLSQQISRTTSAIKH